MTDLPRAERYAYLAAQQALWLLLVWLAALGHTLWPAAIAGAAVLAFLWRLPTARRRVAVLIAVGLACGIAVDGSLANLGLVRYAGEMLAPGVPPLWILALWALFAAALVAAPGLTNPWIAGLAIGAPGGALAYAAARAIGAIALELSALWVVAAFYALAVPILVLTANRLLERQR
ncbi:MAG: DUF2878 family protein [Planctomycetota bacterium]|nr:DUF2878 family protein [Planctomycetota bacterium]MCX8040649.1 DUF2878 family protein [Planctomycetota bacterium]MDW8372792.1 DUF2878 family protein [Planctomycetota bacterium]